MKVRILSILLAFTIVISGCGSSGIVSPAPGAPTIQDQASLIRALQAAGATVETGDSITQDFFSVAGRRIKVNSRDLQVFEYASQEAMEKDASQVAPDGSSIGTAMVTWIDTPHFYKAGRIIALYLGSDQRILNLLKKVIGPQFAGG